MKVPAALQSFTFKSAVGAYETEGACHRVRVGMTPFGVVELPEDSLTATETRLAEARANGSARFTKLSDAVRARLGRKPRAAASAPPKPRVSIAVVGLRPERVTFISEAASADAAAKAGTLDPDAEKSEKAANAILTDSIGLAVGKGRFIATAKVRKEELDATSNLTGYAIADGHRFEPGPWALWRASLHHAPLKPKGKIHLRYIVGPAGGVVVLSGADRPLAWQVVAHESDKEWFDSLLHAFHVLDLFAVRKLNLPAIAHVSVQGATDSDPVWDDLKRHIGREIVRVPGPAYEPRLVAFGAALGALDLKTQTLNLAKSMQDPPRLLTMVPWGEIGLLVAMFIGMFLVMRYYISDASQQLATLKQRAVAAAWADGMTAADLKKEAATLEKEVTPLKLFVTRDLYFSRGLESLAQSLPPDTWIVNMSADDLIWEKSANKALGQRYIMINAGAPSPTEGAAPPEINEAVHALTKDEYLKKVLPNAKLTDVNWHRQSGVSFALFSVLALPKQ